MYFLQAQQPVRALVLTSLAITCVIFTSNATAQVVFEANFDHHTSGLYTEDDLDADFNTPVWEDGVREGRISIVEGAEAYGGSGSSLAVAYPSGEHGTKETGGQWKLDLDEEYEEAYLSYRIKFKSGFDFVRGGKLPGLAGGSSPSGSSPADGFNGWTGRLMWRTDFEGTSGSPEQLVSNAISYAKYTDSGFAGDGEQEDKLYWFGADDDLKPINSGQWYQITQRVKLNQPGVADGILQIWLDGELVHDQTDVLFRLTPDLKIDQMYFSTFFGGGSSWKTSKDETVYFDDFVISVPRTKYLKVPQFYDTVQDALDEAIPGDVVAIRGTQRGNFVVDKPILFRGYTGTVIIADDNSKPAVSVEFAGAEVKRLDVRFGSVGVEVKENCEEVRVNFCKIRNSPVGILVGDNCHGSVLFKNEAINNAVNGIVMSNSSSLRIFSTSAALSGGSGFVLTGVDDLRIKDCRSSYNGQDGVRASGDNVDLIDIKSYFNDGAGFNLTVNNSDVEDCDARENLSHGFQFSNSSDNSVEANLSRDNTGSGYLLASSSDNNEIVSNTSRYNLNNGFEIDDSAGNELTSGYSHHNGASGYYLSPSSLGNTVVDNRVLANLGLGFLDEGANDVSDNLSDDGTGE